MFPRESTAKTKVLLREKEKERGTLSTQMHASLLIESPLATVISDILFRMGKRGEREGERDENWPSGGPLPFRTGHPPPFSKARVAAPFESLRDGRDRVGTDSKWGMLNPVCIIWNNIIILE